MSDLLSNTDIRAGSIHSSDDWEVVVNASNSRPASAQQIEVEGSISEEQEVKSNSLSTLESNNPSFCSSVCTLVEIPSVTCTCAEEDDEEAVINRQFVALYDESLPETPWREPKKECRLICEERQGFWHCIFAVMLFTGIKFIIRAGTTTGGRRTNAAEHMSHGTVKTPYGRLTLRDLYRRHRVIRVEELSAID